MRTYRRSRVRSSRGHVRVDRRPPWMRWAVRGVVIGCVAVVAFLVLKQFVLNGEEEQERAENNRTWLEFAWAMDPVNPDAVQQLGERLRSNGINRVYLEASAWRSDNALIEAAHAADFARELRSVYPQIKILLWLRMSGEQIAQPELQAAVTQLSQKAIQEWKFDGVQLNSRAVIDGSESYIGLLRQLRTVLGSEALLSVTVPPDRIPSDPEVPIGPTIDPNLTWGVNYKQRVGLLQVDEIVIMAHASGLTDSKAYETWVAYQITSYTEVLSRLERPVDIIVALPTYDAAPEHDPLIEDVSASIRGVKLGIKNAGSQRQWIKGVGLYEYKTTDSLEWARYREEWLLKDNDQ